MNSVDMVLGIRERRPPQAVSLVERVLGEAGLAARADGQPPHNPPRVYGSTPASPAGSDADLAHREAHPAAGDHVSVFDTVVELWRAGKKTEACQQMLFSEFSYEDFVRFVQSLPEDEGVEAGRMLTDMAPKYAGAPESGDKALQAFLGQQSGEQAQMDAEARGQA